MKVSKVVNNNLVMVKDQNGQDVILKGKGIGFHKKVNDDVDDQLVEKRFVIEDTNVFRKFNDIIIDMDGKCISVSMEIVDMIKSEIGVPLSDMLYVTLTDHIWCLLKRLDLGIRFNNHILWDVKRLYTREYALGKRAVEILNQNYGLSLDNDEASFFALHIVTSEMNTEMKETMLFTAVINSICDIVESEMGITLDENDYFYNRFIMHLKFCFENHPGVHTGGEQSEELLNKLFLTYSKERRCLDKIVLLIEKSLGRIVGTDEKLYLYIHIIQMLNREANE